MANKKTSYDSNTEVAARLSQELNRGTIMVQDVPHFAKPRVWKITNAENGVHVGELTNGKYAIGKLRSGTEPPSNARIFETHDQAKQFFISKE